MQELEDKDRYHVKEPVTLGVALERFLASRPHMRERLDEAQLQQIWRENSIPYVVEQTRAIRLRQGVLRIEIASSALRANLNMQRDRLSHELNGRMGRAVVTKIVFT